MEKPQLHVLGLKLSGHCLAIRRKGHVTGLATRPVAKKACMGRMGNTVAF